MSDLLERLSEGVSQSFVAPKRLQNTAFSGRTLMIRSIYISLLGSCITTAQLTLRDIFTYLPKLIVNLGAKVNLTQGNVWALRMKDCSPRTILLAYALNTVGSLSRSLSTHTWNL